MGDAGERPAGEDAALRVIDQKRTAGRSVDAAQRRAGENPEAHLPCPACATSLKGANFERHLREKHPDAVGAAPGSEDAELTLVGIDRRIRRTFGALIVLWLVVLGAVVAANPGPTGGGADAPGAQIASAPFVIVVALGMLAAAVIAMLRAAKAFRARMTVTREGIALSHRMGTGRRQVPLPAAVETGTLFIRRNYGTSGGGQVEVRSGAYLRMGEGRRSITVGCPHATGVRKLWVGWTPGKRRTWWDVDLSAPAFVELQYALAESGCLVPAT